MSVERRVRDGVARSLQRRVMEGLMGPCERPDGGWPGEVEGVERPTLDDFDEMVVLCCRWLVDEAGHEKRVDGAEPKVTAEIARDAAVRLLEAAKCDDGGGCILCQS